MDLGGYLYPNTESEMMIFLSRSKDGWASQAHQKRFSFTDKSLGVLLNDRSNSFTRRLGDEARIVSTPALFGVHALSLSVSKIGSKECVTMFQLLLSCFGQGSVSRLCALLKVTATLPCGLQDTELRSTQWQLFCRSSRMPKEWNSCRHYPTYGARNISRYNGRHQ